MILITRTTLQYYLTVLFKGEVTSKYRLYDYTFIYMNLILSLGVQVITFKACH